MRKPYTAAETNLPKMARMMDVVGVDPVDLAQAGRGVAYGQAVRRCASCEHTGACEAWLATHEGAHEAPPFCANREFFNRARP